VTNPRRRAEQGGGQNVLSRHKALSALLALTLALAGVWGVRLWQLRHDVGRFSDFWSLPRGEAGGLVYVAMGDSTAQGIGATSPERGYVGLLAERLRTATKRQVRVINLSVSGARVRDVVTDQLPRLAGLNADVLTVAVGANDIGDYEVGKFNADVDALVAGLPANAVVADIPWFMHGGTGRRSDQAAEYLARAAQARDLPFAGLHDATRRRGWPSMLTDFAVDWFHPRDRGYRVWTGAFWEAMISHPALAPLRLPDS
jgi:acyl-CoA thioesterase-1